MRQQFADLARCVGNWPLFAARKSKNLRRAWAILPISVMPCSKPVL